MGNERVYYIKQIVLTTIHPLILPNFKFITVYNSTGKQSIIEP